MSSPSLLSPRTSSLDDELIARLQRAFAAHAGTDARIDAAELQRALGLRGEYLANRILVLLDTNGDGSIDRDEFLRGVHALVFGSTEEKLRFAFRLHDHDDDGSIDSLELRRMITIGLIEDDVSTTDAEIDRLTAVLLRTADRNADGRISFDELAAAMEPHPELLAQMTRSEARWLAPNEDLLARAESKRRPWLARQMRALVDHRSSVAILTVWFALNVIFFARAMLAPVRGHGPAVGPPWLASLGRACTSCILLNVSFLFLPVLRRLLTQFRVSRAGRIVNVDGAIDFHRLVGFSVVALGLGHAVARLVSYTGRGDQAFAERLLSKEGITGLSMLVAMLVMAFFAREAVRRSGRFELFYFTHLLYILWLVLAVLHAPAILGWGAPVLLGFVAEQVLRLRQRTRAATVVDARPLRSGVTRLEIARPQGFTHRAGDYLFLKIPQIARYEWHPFTISSAPEATTLTVHVRALGNWTSALRRGVERGPTAPAISAFIDGPYGSPTGHIFDASRAVMIAAGIGVTPFASVLESLVHRSRHAAKGPGSRLEKVHFVWLNRDQVSFEWFTALLADLEAEAAPGSIDLSIYMTGAHGGLRSAALEVARELAHAEGNADVVTGLSARTHSGPPNWRELLQSIAREHAPLPVPVYFCGPPGLAQTLRPICADLRMPFREERF